jgi:antitoxin component of RelBE/YafQ-DinJ toxin-antitoxin module
METEWINGTSFIILPSRKRMISLRLDQDIINKYDRLVAKLRLRNINITRTALLELILTRIIERPELIADLLF